MPGRLERQFTKPRRRSDTGDPVEAAKYYDFDEDFLLELEPEVCHYDAYDA